MVGMHAVPGDPAHAVVVSQEGVLYRANLQDAGAAPSVFLDIRNRIIGDPGNEEGLLGLAFAPDYATSGRFYVHYSAGGPRRGVVSRFVANGASADPASEQVILEVAQPYANHNGGGMAFGPEGMLYLAFGDGGSAGDPQGNGQRLDTLLGKILRIDVSGAGYGIPADNPFVGRGRGEIWAYGLRNPWRITFDRGNGQLWSADVGQNAWEEVNRIVPGGNYGWSVLEGDACYRAATCDRSGKLAPRATYSHEFGCSVTGGYVYRGQAMPELVGWYVYGDYCSGRVWALNAATNEGAAIPLADTGVSITSFFEDAAGELYVVSPSAIYRLAPK
jgi:glucose/arabinose dehydrogenase